ncbi:FAD-dependent oxidoreductase [Micromonospora echinospora]|uniref:oxidoreductase n=1 Tax=Micromonospora echinospora TaxID=1877 RepID=UPI0033DE7719
MLDEKLRQLLMPVRLASLTLRNRVFVPGHTTNFGLHNEPTARLAAYHAERARGGVGLIITEAIRVHPTSAGRSISLGSFTDASIPAYQRVTRAVHEHGAVIFAQIMHAGRQANGDATRTAAWSSSPVAWATGAHVPHAMGRRDITTVVDAFAAAARRMQRAGFDGLEIHAGHGHLLQQFLSPHTNHRDDDYGGSLANRMRLTREVLDAVYAAGDLPVGLRVSADEFLPGGLDPDAVVEIVAQLRADYPLAYVHVSHSAYHGSWSLATQMADMSFGHAPFRHHAARFSREFPDLPVLAVCRLDSLPEAAELVAAGEADLVGLARPHIADPYLVRKAAEGRQHQTRACLACNQGCIARVEASLPITCVVNPEVGAEREWRSAWRQPTSPRRVLVVGGGPAGLAAATAARRAGHRVTLAEAADDLGGQVRVAVRVPGRERLGLLTRDLAAEARAADVEILLGHWVTAAEVRDGDYHDVVLATGSRPARRDLPGGPPVLDLRQAVDVLDAPHPPHRRVRRPRRRRHLGGVLGRRGAGPAGSPGAPCLPDGERRRADHHLLPPRPADPLRRTRDRRPSAAHGRRGGRRHGHPDRPAGRRRPPRRRRHRHRRRRCAGRGRHPVPPPGRCPPRAPDPPRR